MKGLRNFILLFVFVIIALPVAAGGAALAKAASVPAYLNGFNYNNYDVQTVLTGKAESIVLDNVLGQKAIYIDEQTVNKLIYKYAGGFSDVYIQLNNTETIQINDLWVSFENNTLTLYGLVTYHNVQTTLTVSLAVENIDTGLKITVNSVQVGKLTVPKSLFTQLLKGLDSYFGISLKADYTYGDMSYDGLYITVNSSDIDNYLSSLLNTNLIQFSDVSLQKGELMINYNYNPADAQTINQTIAEVKRVAVDSATPKDVQAVLDMKNSADAAFYQDFSAVLNDVIIPAVEAPSLTDLTDSQIAELNNLATAFSSLDASTQDNVVNAVASEFNQNIINQFNTQILGNFTQNDYDNFANLINGFLSSGYAN